MVRKLPQIYGTQYIRKDENSLWEKYLMDSDKVSDEERKEYCVESLAEQKLTLERMNKKVLIEKYQANGSADDIIKYCKENHGKETEYDLSWRGISKFGFQLKRLGKVEEALQIFHTSIELYPEEYDLYHSIGLIYAELGKKEIGIKFLEKAIELNPKFEEGKRDLKELKIV